jgi:hypothetical protein
VIESWAQSVITNEAAFAVLVASRRVTKGLEHREDWETLLRTSRELWGDAPQEQGMLCNPWAVWQCTVATDLRFVSKMDTVEDFFGNIGTAAMRLVGARVDIRDAQSIAEEYLEHGREALRDVSGRYLARVAAKIVEIQESRAGSEEEAEALRAGRAERHREIMSEFKRNSASRER